MTFIKDLESLINQHSKENASNTPDFLLAEYINDCLGAYEKIVSGRDKWYGYKPWDAIFADTQALSSAEGSESSHADDAKLEDTK